MNLEELKPDLRVRGIDTRGRGPHLPIHHAARARGCNVIAVVHDSGHSFIAGRVPRAPTFNQGRPGHRHQPWSNVVILSSRYTDYTIAHEVGHILGLGEGHREYLEYTDRNGHRILSGAERRTTPGAEGTPMALPAQAGRDPNEDQLQAIIEYSIRARDQVSGEGSFGPEVDGYRARVVSA